MGFNDVISMGKTFHGVGWHNPEGSEDNPIRWMTSGGEASISIIADQMRSVQVNCELVSYISKKVFSCLDILVDNEPVEFHLSEQTTGLLLYFYVNKRKMSPVTKVTFCVPEEFYPDGPDRRLLSLAFKKIYVSPIQNNSVTHLLLLGGGVI